MVYKYHIKRGDKVFGPYYYKSYRDGKHTRKEYLGKGYIKTIQAGEKRKSLLPFFVLLISFLIFFFFMAKYVGITGKANLELSSITFLANESVTGKLNLQLKQGELMPENTDITVKISNENYTQTKQIELKNLVKESNIEIEKEQGSFFVENTQLAGIGIGYGSEGTRTIQPLIYFQLEITALEETNKEITKIIYASAVSGQASIYDLSNLNNETALTSINARIVEDSVYYFDEEGKKNEISVQTLNIETTSSQIIVTTNFSYQVQGFGQDFINENSTTLALNLSALQLAIEEPGIYNLIVSFSYQDTEILQASSTITIVPSNLTANHAPYLKQEIPDQTIYRNERATINLAYYFADEDIDTIIYYISDDSNIENLTISLDYTLNIAEIIPDINWTGIRKVVFTATDNIAITKSNIIDIFVVEKPSEIITNITLPQPIQNITNITLPQVNITVNETTIQHKTVIGQSVKWTKHVKLDKQGNITVKLPIEASNITVKKIENETVQVAPTTLVSITGKAIKIPKGIEQAEQEPSLLQKAWQDFLRITGFAVSEQPEQEQAGFETEIKQLKEAGYNEFELELTENTTEYEIEYYTNAPEATEQEITSYKKQITISGPDILHYENVLAFTSLPEIVPLEKQHAISLYHLVNETKQKTDFIAFDDNNNSFIDRIEWQVPSLSNQTYETSITIINVKTYPTLYGNWTVYFNTTGEADLTITAINSTTWNYQNDSCGSETCELRFENITCGSTLLNYIWQENSQDGSNNSVFYANYSCNEEGSETSIVLRAAEHTLQFKFGTDTAYAFNQVSQFNTATSDIALAPVNNETFVVAWINSTGNQTVFQVRYTNGSKKYNPVVVNTSVGNWSRVGLAMINSTAFMIGWTHRQLQGALYNIYNISGTALSTNPIAVDITIGTTGYDIALSSFAQNHNVSYCYIDAADADWSLNQYNSTRSSVLSSTLDLDTTTIVTSWLQNKGDCVAVNSSLVISAWYDEHATAGRNITLKRVNRGITVLSTTLIDNIVGLGAQVAVASLNSNAFAILYYNQTQSDIVLTIRNANNVIVKAPTIIESNSGTNATRVATAVVNNGTTDYLVAVWFNQSSNSIVGKVFTNAGTQVGGAFAVDNRSSVYPLIYATGKEAGTNLSICSGKFIVAYTNSTNQAVLKTYDIDGTEWNGICPAPNNAPETRNVTIFPTNAYAYTNSTLNCSAEFYDLDLNSMTVNFTWYNNSAYYNSSTFSGITNGSLKSHLLLPAGIQAKNEVWNCTVFANDGTVNSKLNSTTRTISNLAPWSDVPTILPATAYGNSTLNCSTIGYDIDLDPVTVNFTWYNGTAGTVYYNSSTFTSSNGTMKSHLLAAGIQAAGETWNCTVYINNSVVGNPASSTRAISNLAPGITKAEILPATVYKTSNLTYNFTIEDVDLDSMTCRVLPFKDNIAQTSLLKIFLNQANDSKVLGNLTNTSYSKGETWLFQAWCNDSSNVNSSLVNTSSKTIQNSVPTITTVTLNPDSGLTKSTVGVNCTVNGASDADADTLTHKWQWFKNNIPSVTTQNITNADFNKDDVLICQGWVSDNAPSNSSLINSSSVTVQNTAPEARNVTIFPTNAYAYTNSTLNCSAEFYDLDLNSMTVNFTWYNGSAGTVYYNSSTFSGITNGSLKSHLLLPDGIQARAETWNCTVFANDGTINSKLNSTTRTISNLAPEVQNINLIPSSPFVTQDLECSFITADADLDKTNATVRWYNNSILALTQTLNNNYANSTTVKSNLTSGNLTAGETWLCEAWLNDSQLNSSKVNSSSVVIQSPNIAPEIVANEILPATVYKTSNLTYNFTAEDDNGDKMNFSVLPFKNNIAQTSLLQTLLNQVNGSNWKGNLTNTSYNKGETWLFQIWATDKSNVNSTLVNTSTRTIQNTAPTITSVTLTPSSNVYKTTVGVNCTINGASDADADALTHRWQWFKNNIPSVTTQNITNADFNKNDVLICQGWVSDNAPSNSSLINSSSVTVLNSAPSITTAVVMNVTSATKLTWWINMSSNSSDVDGDLRTENFRWYVNNIPTNRTSFISNRTFSKNDVLIAEMWVNDSSNVNSSLVNSSTLTAQNSAPTTPEIGGVENATAAAISALLRCENSTDSDGDTINYVFYGGNTPNPTDVLSNSTSATYTWEPAIDVNYYWRCKAEDSAGGVSDYTAQKTFYLQACEFQGVVKDANDVAVDSAIIVILNQTDNKQAANLTTNSTGGWKYNLTVISNYTVIAYHPTDKTQDGDVDPYIECK